MKMLSNLNDMYIKNQQRYMAHIKLARMHQPTGFWLVYLPTMWGLCDASRGVPPLKWLVIFTIGSFVMRAAGCVINDMLDKNFDKQVERTKSRPLANNTISIKHAVIDLVVYLTIAFSCFLTLPKLAKILSILALLMTMIYPYMKRITYYPQLFLGLCFNTGILIAFATIQHQLRLEHIVLYAVAVVWTIYYDTIYAHQDKTFDTQIGVKSLALGIGKSKTFLCFCAATMYIFLNIFGILTQAPWLYFIGCFLILMHLAYQIYKVDLDNPQSCGAIFKYNLATGISILLTIIIQYIVY